MTNTLIDQLKRAEELDLIHTVTVFASSVWINFHAHTPTKTKRQIEQYIKRTYGLDTILRNNQQQLCVSLDIWKYKYF